MIIATFYRDRRGWSKVFIVKATKKDVERLESHYTHTRGIKEFVIKPVKDPISMGQFLVELALDGKIELA